MALASTRPLDEGMVVQDSELWGYLQPVFDTSSDPYIDFPKCDVMHYRWSVAPLDGASNHVIEFTRAANDQPTVLRNLSGAMVVAINENELFRGQARVVMDGDYIAVYCRSSLLLVHAYYFRDPSTPRRPGSLSEHYDRGLLLGQGGFAQVFHLVHRQTRKPFVAKVIMKCPASPSYEISLMKKLNHPNVCNLENVFFEGPQGSIELVMEYCEYGDLFDYINERKILSPKISREITLQICSGMTHVHSKGIVHRDLKPENILIPSRNPTQIKITDFGLAKAPTLTDLLISVSGTREYLAPEVIVHSNQGIPYDNRVDSWSVGIIVLVMLTGLRTWPPDWVQGYPKTYKHWLPVRRIALRDLRKHGYHRRVQGKVHQFCQALLEVCPEDRPTLEDALDLPWLRN